MADSKKKLSDSFKLVSTSSTEHLGHTCELCLNTDRHPEIVGFCVNCNKYICRKCFAHHQKTETSKDHTLIDKEHIEKHRIPNTCSDGRTENCHLHKDKKIKYFCRKHEELGCSICMTFNHGTCDFDSFIDKCADIADSVEYKKTTLLLNEKMKQVETVKQQATKREKEIDICCEKLMNEINELQREMISRIQELGNKIKMQVERKKSLDKEIIQHVLNTCTTLSSDVNKFQSSLQNFETTKQNEQLYITMKRAMAKLKSDETEKSEEALETTNMQYRFELSQGMQKLRNSPDAFGKLTLSATLTPPWKTSFDFTSKNEIDIQTKLDKATCDITGGAVLSSNKLVLADYNNKKLKVLDIQSKTITEEKKLNSSPFDLASLPNEQFAVTLPHQEEIHIMTSSTKLSTTHIIQVKGSCTGVTFHQGRIYIVCSNPTKVVILDLEGNVHKTILLQKDIFKNQLYIMVSKDTSHFYISDPVGLNVSRVTLQGKVTATSRDLPMSTVPWGMVMLNDGTLLVCSWNGAIYRLTGSLKQAQKLISLPSPQSLCYNPYRHEMYIGAGSTNKLLQLSLK